MKNVVALIGSLRKESVNRQVYNHYQSLAKDHFSLSEVSIADMPHYNADLEPFPDSVISAAEKIRAADGLLFFSPEYNYSIPGVLKNAIDWLSRVDPNPFAKKPTAIIGASPGAIGTARMQYHLRQVAVFVDMYVLNKPEVMIGGAYQKVKDNQVTDADTVKFLQMHAAAFADFMGELS